jgi:hypothetical protein
MPIQDYSTLPLKSMDTKKIHLTDLTMLEHSKDQIKTLSGNTNSLSLMAYLVNLHSIWVTTSDGVMPFGSMAQ